MDEEEELENTLIGQQEEEAPAVNTEGALMGNIPSNNLVSFVNTTGQQSDAMTQLADTASANIGVPMTGMRPIDPTTGQPLSQAVIDAANRVGLDLPQASVPLPQPASALPALPAVVADQPQAAVSPFLQSPDTPSGLGGPLLRGFEMVNDAARGPNAPMGQDATRARLGGMTLNEYLNAPAGTPGVSGLRTDPQGRMISSPAPAVVNNFAPQTPSVRATPAPFPNTEGGEIRDALFRGPPQQGAVPAFSTGPAKVSDEIMSQVVRTGGQTAEFRDSNRDGIEDREQGIFRPGELLGYDAQGNEVRAPGTQQPVNRIPATAQPSASALSDFERASLERQQRIGGTGSFAGDSAAREARLAARPDFNEVRRDRDRRGGGISQADARDLAQGMARGATEGERARALEIQSRLGLGQFEPERELTDLEKREIESQIRAREAGIAASERKGSFEPRIVTIDGQRAIELSPGNFQQIQKDTPNKTGLQKTLENLQADLDAGRLTQEEYDIGIKNARDLYIRREKPKGQTTENEFINIITGAQAGDTPTVDATDAPQVATGRGQARRGRPVETDDSTPPSPVRVNSQAEYDALPVGTPYIDSQGTETVKK
jgi:hypothetical protein